MTMYAGFWRRALASLIDAVLFVVCAAIFLNPLLNVAQSTVLKNTMDHVLAAVITVVLWVCCLGTPGKILLGCQVVDASTRKPLRVRQAILRYTGYLASILSLGLGFAWIAWDKRRQGFHDKIANTVVVYNQEADRHDESQKPLNRLISELR